MRRQDPLIAGGGPAGAAAAIALARGGTKPVLLERSRETGDALCGGFLSWRTLASLKALGLETGNLGHRVTRLRLFSGNRKAESPLPGLAVAVSRHRLDTLLLDLAGRAGAGIERGVTVKRLDGERRLTLGDGATLEPESLFVATGKHDLSGLGRTRADDDPALGLRVRLAAHPGLAALVGDAIELHLFKGGYVGLVLQEAGDANLCLAVRKSRLAEAGGDPATLLRQLGEAEPALGERLAFMAATPAVDAIGAVPYGYIARETAPSRYRIGDQAGVIPSLAGEGMGIAIASGAMAARAWLEGEDAPQFQHRLAARLDRPVGLAKLIWRLAERSPGLATSVVAAWPALAAQLAKRTRIGD